MRFTILMVMVMVLGCGDDLVPLAPDAAAPSCCALYPDVSAIAACIAPPPGACGRAHCETVDGPIDIPVCGSPP